MVSEALRGPSPLHSYFALCVLEFHLIYFLDKTKIKCVLYPSLPHKEMINVMKRLGCTGNEFRGRQRVF
jgi:hypothetical protein